MEFILFNVEDSLKKTKIIKHEISEKCYINEIVLSGLKQWLENKPGCINKIKMNLLEKRLKKDVKKALNGNLTKWYYALNNNIVKDEKMTKYLKIELQKILGYEFVESDEMKQNLTKYIDEHVNKISIKDEQVKMLMVYKKEKDIDISLIDSLIKKYKTVNIYLLEKPTEYILNRISNINIQNGTTIEIIKQGKKAFLEYDVIYFVNGLKSEFPRLRFNKKALIIDNITASKDKYNSNVIYIKNNEKLNLNNIYRLQQNYGDLKLAQIVKKIVN